MSRLSALLCIGLTGLIAGCAANAATTSGPYSLEQARYLTQRIRSEAPLQLPGGPIVIAMNYTHQTLEYWQIDPKGGRHPQPLAKPQGLSGAGPMAASGSRIVIANQNATNLIVYDLAKHKEKILADPDGYPSDVAIDTRGGIYASSVSGLSASSVLWYPPGGLFPKSLRCRFLTGLAYIAVDNEGDIFLNDNAAHFVGVIEIPRGPKGPDPAHCARLNLKPESYHGSGIAVDPKTDDLVVLDSGGCASGGGTMTIYPKPYRRETGVSHQIGGGCPTMLRLDATSTIAFFVDQQGSIVSVGQRSYPDGKTLSSYLGGVPSGVTTIPNTLPN